MNHDEMSPAARRALEYHRSKRREERKNPVGWNHYVPPSPDPPPEVQPPEIGSRMTFLPSAFVGGTGHDRFADLREKVTGTVVQVNDAHRWYRVAYEMGTRYPCIGYECFKY